MKLHNKIELSERYYMSSGFAGDYEDITFATFATVADIPQVNELYSLFLGKKLNARC